MSRTLPTLARPLEALAVDMPTSVVAPAAALASAALARRGGSRAARFSGRPTRAAASAARPRRDDAGGVDVVSVEIERAARSSFARGGSSRLIRQSQASRGRRRRRATTATRAMAGGETDYYALLGVSKTADAKEIKRAFRKAALKYHPDVNKAADATTRFNEYKTAYNTLSNPDERRKYDILRAGGGFGAAWGGGASRSSWGAGTSSSSSPPRGYKPKEEEEFYGFGQFFEDMEKEWREFEKSRPDPGRPRTLWEELSALGEEFVDFLEEATPEVAEAVKDARARDPFDAYEATFRDDEKRAEGYARRGGAASSASPKKEDTVDDMLDALKRKMGKK